MSKHVLRIGLLVLAAAVASQPGRALSEQESTGMYPNDSTKAGPAPMCSEPPAAAVPTVEKMPAPTIAPMPRKVSCTGPSVRRSWWAGRSVSSTRASIGFTRNHSEIRITAASGADFVVRRKCELPEGAGPRFP